MRVAKTFDEIKSHELPPEVYKNEYVKAFVNELMDLSNRLNEIEDNEDFRDDLDIKEDYLPLIQEFIFNIEG